MIVSQNGWPIRPAARRSLVVAGVTIGPVRIGAVFVVLEYLAHRFHQEVQPLRAGQCGAYNDRHIAGTETWSNHASATALDLNWKLNPEHARGTFTPAQLAALRKILASCDGVVRWGGDYSDPDPMHFEIDVRPGDPRLNALVDKIQHPSKAAPVDMNNPTVQAVNWYFSQAYRASQHKATLPYPDPKVRAATPAEKLDRFARNAFLFLSQVDGVDPEPDDE